MSHAAAALLAVPASPLPESLGCTCCLPGPLFRKAIPQHRHTHLVLENSPAEQLTIGVGMLTALTGLLPPHPTWQHLASQSPEEQQVTQRK